MQPVKRLISVFAVLISSFSFSQEGLPVYFDYLTDNYYLIHPSMAGAAYGGKIRLTARQQWFDVDAAPNLQTLSANARLGESKSGLGAILFNDANGYHSQTGLKFTYAHHLLFSRNEVDLNQLSFGLSVGFIQSTLDESEFVSIVPDPIITNTANSVTYYNVDFGFSYHYLDTYAHVTVKNALGSGRDLYTAQEFDNLRRYLISVGHVFGKREWQFEPSVLLQITEFTQEKTVDINGKVYKELNDDTLLWGGLSYRRSFDGAEFNTGSGIQQQKLQLLTPLLGINYKRFLFAYNYSYQTGDVRFDNGGFHQITLGYDFGERRDPYDCKCPAINR